jgi:hypothetical protein
MQTNILRVWHKCPYPVRRCINFVCMADETRRPEWRACDQDGPVLGLSMLGRHDDDRCGHKWQEGGPMLARLRGDAPRAVLCQIWLDTRDAGPRPLSTWAALSLARVICGETALILSRLLASQTRVDPCLWGCGRAFHLIHRSACYITALSILPPLCFRRVSADCSVYRPHTTPLEVALLLNNGSLITPSNPADVHHIGPPGSVDRYPCVQLHINTTALLASFLTHHLHRFNSYALDHASPTNSIQPNRTAAPSHTMSNGSNSPPLHSPAATDRRRASVTSQTFQDLFGRSNGYVGQQSGAQGGSGSITTAAVNAQRRRLSLTTIGLGASPGQTSPFLNQRTRTESISSANSGSVDESPFEDDYALSTSATSSNPATPFARRLSFGARALRDVRQSNGSVGNPNGRPSVHKASSPPTGRGRGLSSLSRSLPAPIPLFVGPFSPGSFRSKSISHIRPPPIAEHVTEYSESEFADCLLTSPLTGEGYNFAENLRTRAERGSMSGPPPMLSANGHQRAKSVAIMEPPAREMPKQPKVPDAMQERILKGDFYMD